MGESLPKSGRNLQDIKHFGRTYCHQDQLPRLPIPDLSVTLQKYLQALEALLDPKELQLAKQNVQDFLENDGPFLQEKLQAYERQGFEDCTLGSYVEAFWNDAYLNPDASVVLNLNPYFILQDYPKKASQLEIAGHLAWNSVQFASMLRLETLRPDTWKKTPLCMDQYKALFGSSRIPSKGNDDIHVYSDSKHICVLCCNQIYSVPVLNDQFDAVLDAADLQAVLHEIQEDAQQLPVASRSQSAVGVLTSLPRSQWGKCREKLSEIETNRQTFNLIDAALFVLVLDDVETTNIHQVAGNVLHGTSRLDGDLQVGSCMNRWYDKLQFIIGADGSSGIIFEHSVVDGHTALRLASDVYANSLVEFANQIVKTVHGTNTIAPILTCNVKREPASYKKLTFDVNSLKREIFYAETALSDAISSSDTHVLEFTDYGKRFVVQHKMSPDAFVQMSILLSYYRLYGRVVNMYEPALTKAFFHGRTEAIRGATRQSKAFCEAFVNDSLHPTHVKELLKQALVEHSRLTKLAAQGLGVDRHLYALKCIADKEVPFFQSQGWKALNHTVLSTSNCGNPSLRLFGFGPVVPDGFGVGYVIKDNGISYSVSSNHRQTKRYVDMLRKTLVDLREMVITGAPIETPNVVDVDFWGETDIPHAESSHRSSKLFSHVKVCTLDEDPKQ